MGRTAPLRLGALLAILAAALLVAPAGAAEAAKAKPAAELSYDAAIPQAAFGAARLRRALEPFAEVRVVSPASPAAALFRFNIDIRPDQGKDQLKPGGFAIEAESRAGSWRIGALDPAGAMYGALDAAEQIRMHGGPLGVQTKTVNPRFPFRAIKFNLPWMSYRKHESLQLHDATCRDLKFWERFLDMMAENRYNALTLWSLHPFGYMIRPKNFPEACAAANDQELAEWKTFWTTLFRMAKERGIETYLVNWNIFVSPELAKAKGWAKYSADWSFFGDADASAEVKRYTKECVTQVIDEYPDLTGLGITLGERMGGMTPQEREDWLIETFGEGIKAARRPVKFIHRAPLSADKGSGGSTDKSSTAEITRAGIDKLLAGGKIEGPMLTEFKFNWSHAYTSPRLCIIHGGKASEGYWNPKPEKYKVAWMMRNEDFFTLRWGSPAFIREHIRLNGPDYVGGYFVGSECYIPAKNYIDKDLKTAPQYAFERQWLLYMLWGRLLFDPQTPDSVFENAFDERYGQGVGKRLAPALARVSETPLILGCFYKPGWDFTLYSEGFLAPSKKGTPFITIDDLISAEPLDPAFISIRDYVRGVAEGRKFDGTACTPPAMAQKLEDHAMQALALNMFSGMRAGNVRGLEYEIADINAWGRLSRYFALKLRAGVALETFRRTKNQGEKAKAVNLLEQAAKEWDEVIAITRPLYNEIPLIHTGERKFSWAEYRADVQRDIDIARNAQ